MHGGTHRRGSDRNQAVPAPLVRSTSSAGSANAGSGGRAIDPLLGPSRASRELNERLSRIAASRVPVLIEGEVGTGRGEIARRIHDLSPRARAPFQCFDCATVPESLLSRELFGHRRGAFTGADRDDSGRLRAASGGSFYLHGIDNLPASGQGALLRVLQEGEVLPLGDVTPQAVDLRFIESSERPLASQVREGTFRTDLFYRLNGLQIELTPLRERPEDVNFYLEWLLRRDARRLGRPVPRLRDDLRRLLVGDPWPGNLAELEGAIEGMLALSSSDFMTPHDLPASLAARLEERGEAPAGTRTFSIPASLGFTDQVAFFQRVLIQRVWRECGRDRRRLAARLGIEAHQLRYWTQKLDIDLR